MKFPAPWTAVTLLASAALLCLVAAGCGDDDDPPTKGGKSNAGKGEDLPEWHGKLMIEAKSAGELEELIAAQEGKVVVVQLWATWHPDSTKGLRELVKLQKRFGDRVAAVAVNTDVMLESPDDAEAKVRPILEEADARFENVLSATPDEELFASLGLMTFGVVVYNEQGEAVERFNHPVETGEKGFSYDKDITPAVRTLLGASQ